MCDRRTGTKLFSPTALCENQQPVTPKILILHCKAHALHTKGLHWCVMQYTTTGTKMGLLDATAIKTAKKCVYIKKTANKIPAPQTNTFQMKGRLNYFFISKLKHQDFFNQFKKKSKKKKRWTDAFEDLINLVLTEPRN